MQVSISELATECGVSVDDVENELEALAHDELGGRCWEVPGNAAHYVVMDTDAETFLRLSAALKIARRIMGSLDSAEEREPR